MAQIASFKIWSVFMRLIRFFLFIAVTFSLNVAAQETQEYEIEGGAEGEAEICIPEEECDKEVSYRCRRRYRRRRRCCCNRDIDASWPGKMQDSFYDEMTW